MSICLHGRVECCCIFCNPPEPPSKRIICEDVIPPTSEELFNFGDAFEFDFLRTIALGLIIGFLIGLLF